MLLNELYEGEFRALDIEEFVPSNEQLNYLHQKFVPDWEMFDHRELRATYIADNHRQAEELTKFINDISENMDHFTEVTQDFSEVTIRTTTTDVKGLTILDFRMAMSIDTFAKEKGITQNKVKGNFEGKSPHKKGTKKYKAHMAAMHANEDAKMAKQSDDNLKKLMTQFRGQDQSVPSTQFMIKRIGKEMKKRGLTERATKQDKDIKGRKGTQPAKYHKGLAKSTKAKRDAQFKKGASLPDRDPASYKPAPGDARAKTKPSKHTLKYRKMFGEDAHENQIDAVLPTDEKYVLQADDPKYVRGLVVVSKEDGSYDVNYWYKDAEKIAPIEVIIDGKSVSKDAKVIKLEYHPDDYYAEDDLQERDYLDRLKQTITKAKMFNNPKAMNTLKKLYQDLKADGVTNPIGRLAQLTNIDPADLRDIFTDLKLV